MTSQVLYLASSLVTLVVVVEMVRRRALREKYAVLWTLTAVVVLVIGIFPETLVAASDVLGVQVPANLLFFLASLVLLLVSVQQSAELGRLEERTRTLAEECAELRLRTERLEPHGSDAGDDG